MIKKSLVVSILFVLFRVPIFAVMSAVLELNIRGYARFIVILPIVIALFYFLKVRRVKRFDKYPVLLLIILTIGLGMSYSFYLSIHYPELSFTDILKVFSIYHFFLIFPFLLFNLRLTKDDYRNMIDNIAFVVLNVGGLLVIFEWLGYHLGWFSPKDTLNFLDKGVYLLRDNEIRPIGILADAAHTSILLTACTAYYFNQKLASLKNALRHRQRLKYRWKAIVIGIVSVFAIGSLTSILILIITIMFTTWIYYKSFFKKAHFLLAFFLIFGLLWFLPVFNNYNRFLYYINEKDRYIPNWLFSLSGANFPYWGYYSNSGLNIGEFHFFEYMTKYGFLPFLPWIMLILSPLIKITRLVSLDSEDRAPMILCLTFILSIIHYSGLECWGNNYLYALAAIMLFKKGSLQ